MPESSRRKTKVKQRKQRGLSNKIGEIGEKSFDAAAINYGLIADSFKNDYGFDFICQVAEDHVAKMSYLRGTMIAVSVRTTEKSSGRIVLDRADARHLLQADVVCMVALVHLVKGEAPAVYVRLLDESFRKELGTLLRTDQASISYTPRDFTPIAHVLEMLAPAFRRGFVDRTRIAAVMAGVERFIPGFRMNVTQSDTGEWTAVTAENLFSLFQGAGDDGPDPRYVTAFGAPRRMAERMRELDIAPVLLDSLDGFPNDLIVLGETSHVEADWIVDGDGGRAALTLTSLETADHTGWRHPRGWSLVISKRVLRDGQYVHELEVFADPDEELDLGDSPDLDAFLRHCDSAARIGRDNWDKLPFSAWSFTNLPRQFNFANWLADVRANLSTAEPVAFLRDASDDETMRTLWWLSQLHRDPESSTHRLGFMLGDDPGTPDEPFAFTVPVILNTAAVSLIVELRCEGLLATADDDRITGIQISRVTDFTIDVGKRLEKATAFPEFIFDERLAVALTDSGWKQVDHVPEHTQFPRFQLLDRL